MAVGRHDGGGHGRDVGCVDVVGDAALFRDGAQRLARHGLVVAAARRVRVQLHVGGGLGAPSRRRA